MKVGIYFNRATFNQVRRGKILNELKYLVQEGIPEDVEFFVFCPFGIEWWNKKINGLRYSVHENRWKKSTFSFPDAIYDRATFPEKEKEIGHEVRRILKQDYKILFLNTKHYFNKWETHKILSKSLELKEYLPDTEIYNHPFILEKFLKKYKTIYVKDSGGRLGRNIFKVEKADEGGYIVSIQKNGKVYHGKLDIKGLQERIINGELAEKTVIIQQGINLARFNGRPFDIRILVQKNGRGKWMVVDKSIRVAGNRNSVVTNISAGGEVRKFTEIVPILFPNNADDIEKQVNTISINVCKCLEERYGRLGELGIDAALDAYGKVWLLEVNGKPAKTCVHNSNNPELIHTAYSNIVKYFKYIYNNAQN